ncbi:MAG TPA: hypothetical protein VFJ72_01915 [Rubrobacteraceae bacterium]|nr:hypothetical protein [Rubrobacteraceae bacterium]
MTTRTVESGAVPSRRSIPFERFAGTCAVLTGVTGFLYAVAFVVLQNTLLSGLFLMLGGLLTTAVLVAVYERLRRTEATFALWALLLGMAGALGSAAHGGYDLANAVNPPPSIPDLPNPIDPRGLLTFGVAGIALLIVAWLIVRGGQFPERLGYLGYASAVLLVALYLGRLIFLDPASPLIVVPALLSGFLINPLFYLWLGLALLRGRDS